MNTARKTFDRNYNDLLEFVSVHLPEGWSIELRAVECEASMSLYDANDNYVDCCPEDGDAIDHWLFYINHAREAEGLSEASWNDYWSVKGGA